MAMKNLGHWSIFRSGTFIEAFEGDMIFPNHILVFLWQPRLYKTVVEDVISNVREAFLDEGVDEQVLQELKQVSFRSYGKAFTLYIIYVRWSL